MVHSPVQEVGDPGARRPDPGRLTWPQLVAWAVTRGVVLGLAVRELSRGTLFNDPNLLWSWATGTPFGGEAAPALDEYPGAARLLALTGRLAQTPAAFGWGWVVAFLVIDLTLLAVLARAGRAGAWLWVVGGAALGPVLWLRYDLLVGLLVVLGVMMRERRPAWAGVALGLAVLLKLWPLVIVPALLLRGQWRGWLAALVGTLGAGVVLEIVLRGPGSLLTPVTYQAGRGVQIESLWANPTLLARRGDDPGEVWEFAFRAFQLQGSSTTTASAVTVVVLVAAGLGLLAATHRCRTGLLPALRGYGAAVMAVLVVATNAVFSPQYVMWFAPLVALAVAWTWRAPLPPATLVIVTASTSVLIAALTQVVWPWSYRELLALTPWVLTVLTVRNVAVVVLAGLLAWCVWSLVRPARPRMAAAASVAETVQPAMKDSRT